LEFASDSKTLATNSPWRGYWTVTLWEVATGRVRVILRGATLPLAFSPDGQTLAASFHPSKQNPRVYDPSGSIKLYDVVTGQERAPLKAEKRMWTQWLAFAPDGKTLAAGYFPYDLAFDGKHFLFPTTAFQLLGTVALLQDFNEVRPDRDPRAALWDVATGQQRVVWRYFEPQSAIVRGGKTFLVSTPKTKDTFGLRLWDLETGQERTTFPTLDFRDNRRLSPDGQWLALSQRSVALPPFSPLPFFQADRATFHDVRLVDLISEREQAILPLNQYRNQAIALNTAVQTLFSPDSKTVATHFSNGDEYTGKLWDVPPRKPVGLFLGWAAVLAVLGALVAWGCAVWVRKQTLADRHPTPEAVQPATHQEG
jgi:WD40 repeat protein